MRTPNMSGIFFCFVFKLLLQDFKRIQPCRLQEIFLSCRASLGFLKRGIPHLFIHHPPGEIPPPPSLGTHTDERQTDRQDFHERVSHSYTKQGTGWGFPCGAWDLHGVLLPAGGRVAPVHVACGLYPALHLCLHPPSVSERRMVSATRLKTGVLSKSPGISRVRDVPVFQEHKHRKWLPQARRRHQALCQV